MKIFNVPQQKCGESHRLEALPKGLTTAEIIMFLRKNNGYTIKEIAAICAAPEDTVRNWSRGKNCPREAKRLEIIRIFSDESVTPSIKSRLAARRDHGLTWDSGKRVWKLRLTINIGDKVVGKRICQSMRTSQLEMAIEKRNAVVLAYEKLGLKISKRIQRKPRHA
jgi:DNA-binding transcriptional regulator YiaG